MLLPVPQLGADVGERVRRRLVEIANLEYLPRTAENRASVVHQLDNAQIQVFGHCQEALVIRCADARINADDGVCGDDFFEADADRILNDIGMRQEQRPQTPKYHPQLVSRAHLQLDVLEIAYAIPQGQVFDLNG